MNITIRDDGRVQFEEDLTEWQRKFHNGRSHTVRCAGTQRMSGEKSRRRETETKVGGTVKAIKTEIKRHDSSSSDDSQYDLEKWLERNGM